MCLTSVIISDPLLIQCSLPTPPLHTSWSIRCLLMVAIMWPRGSGRPEGSMYWAPKGSLPAITSLLRKLWILQRVPQHHSTSYKSLWVLPVNNTAMSQSVKCHCISLVRHRFLHSCITYKCSHRRLFPSFGVILLLGFHCAVVESECHWRWQIVAGLTIPEMLRKRKCSSTQHILMAIIPVICGGHWMQCSTHSFSSISPSRSRSLHTSNQADTHVRRLSPALVLMLAWRTSVGKV